MGFEKKLREEIEGFFKHEWKRLDPVYDKIDRFKSDIEKFSAEFDVWNSKLKSAQQEQIKQNDQLEYRLFEELKNLKTETRKYDDKINNLIYLRDANS